MRQTVHVLVLGILTYYIVVKIMHSVQISIFAILEFGSDNQVRSLKYQSLILIIRYEPKA